MKINKEVSPKQLQAIEYALLSTAMETGATKEEIDQGRENLLKVERGEWSDEDYRTNVMKKYNLKIVETPVINTTKSRQNRARYSTER
ncbi:MAG: hypothetical protein LBH40_03895 [Alphaproteobacteria bacterium]|jgi:hypothetical protein|nr:hypothetical protein [Alphaproteobacteria bacterium]